MHRLVYAVFTGTCSCMRVHCDGSWTLVNNCKCAFLIICCVDTMTQCIACFKYDATQATSQYMVQSHHIVVRGTTFHAGLFFGGNEFVHIAYVLCSCVYYVLLTYIIINLVLGNIDSQ